MTDICYNSRVTWVWIFWEHVESTKIGNVWVALNEFNIDWYKNGRQLRPILWKNILSKEIIPYTFSNPRKLRWYYLWEHGRKVQFTGKNKFPIGIFSSTKTFVAHAFQLLHNLLVMLKNGFQALQAVVLN